MCTAIHRTHRDAIKFDSDGKAWKERSLFRIHYGLGRAEQKAAAFVGVGQRVRGCLHFQPRMSHRLKSQVRY